VTSAYVRRRGEITRIAGPLVLEGVGRIVPKMLDRGGDELLLRRDVLDRQVFDGVGARLTRVGDIHLEADAGALRVTAVETGLAAIVRRLGARRIAARMQPRVIGWNDLHLVSGPGHALQLSSPDAAVHRLHPTIVAELIRRAPTRPGSEVLERLHPSRREKVRATLASATPRRRSSDPLSVRKHAPS
jgi:hypothetical protein